MLNKLFGIFLIIITLGAGMAKAADLENTLYLDLKDGRVVIELLPEAAPNHVARIKELAREGFYDGIVFHRVIDGFMAQTGDPTGTGTGGSDKPDLKAEFNDVSHKRGTASMARSGHPDSANSQFFICFEDTSHLDGQYTAWGQVTQGMELVDNIKKGAPGSGQVSNPDKIIKMQVAADVKEEKKAEKKETVKDTKTEANTKTEEKTVEDVSKTEEAKEEVEEPIED